MDCRFQQVNLEHDYEHAKTRMEGHPEYTEECKRIIAKLHPFKSEKEAIEAAVALVKVDRLSSAIVFATIDKDEEFYYVTAPWYVVDGADTMAAEYIGLYPVHDWGELLSITEGHIEIDDALTLYSR